MTSCDAFFWRDNLTNADQDLHTDTGALGAAGCDGARASQRTCSARRGLRARPPRVGRGEPQAGRPALVPGLAPRCAPRPARQAWPGRHQWRERKDGRFPALPQGAQNGGRGARESGRVSHPHKGKGPFPPQSPLHVTPRSTRRRPGTSIRSPSFWSTSS